MTHLGRIVPALWLTAATLLAALPWGLGGGERMLPPLAVAVLIVLIATRRADAPAAWLVLALGLAFDSLTLGPIGFWAMLWLAALGLAQVLRPAAGGILRRLGTGIVVVSGVGGLHWGLASLYQLERQPPAPYVSAAAAAIVLLAATAVLAEAILAVRTGRGGSLKLERGL